MRMFKYIMKRIGWMFLTLAIISLTCFVLVKMVPPFDGLSIRFC